MLLFVIDRFEGSWAVLETPDGTTFNFPRGLLPSGVKEGDTLRFDVSVDEEATRERWNRMKNFLNGLKSQDEGGDIEL